MPLTQINGGMLDSVAQQVGFRNRIINGSMAIDQRNAGASVTIAQGAAAFTVDRWQVGNFRSIAGNLTFQQSSIVPANFRSSLLLTNGVAGANAAGDAVFLQQPIEGFNVADLGWGTADAQPVTISFWVRSSVTGTYGVSVRGTDRSYISSVVISQANTYEYKTITIPAITTGTWNTTNAAGITLLFDLGIGTNNSQSGGSWQNTSNYGLTGGTKWYLTSGATFYITGVQLEKGSTATSFDYRPYGTELQLCQRYFQPVLSATGAASATASLNLSVSYNSMRTDTPTFITPSGFITVTDWYATNTNTSSQPTWIVNTQSGNNSNIRTANISGLTVARPYGLSGGTGYIYAQAEL